MNWIDNMTLKGKLLAGFIAVAIIAGAIGGFGTFSIKQIAAADTKLYEKMTVPLGDMGEISTYFERVRVNSRDIVAADTAVRASIAACAVVCPVPPFATDTTGITDILSNELPSVCGIIVAPFPTCMPFFNVLLLAPSH